VNKVAPVWRGKFERCIDTKRGSASPRVDEFFDKG
jgi:hypothetical protein